jgi:hypothetical protein
MHMGKSESLNKDEETRGPRDHSIEERSFVWPWSLEGSHVSHSHDSILCQRWSLYPCQQGGDMKGTLDIQSMSTSDDTRG